MKMIIQKVNGFTYRRVSGKTLNKKEKLDLRMEIIEIRRAIEINKLNSRKAF